MWMPLRAWWWWSRPREKWPKDVREYVLRRSLKLIRKGAKNASPEEKTRAAAAMIAAGIGTDEISEVLQGDLLEEGLELLASIPQTTCANCNCPIAIHKATKIGEKHYCQTCAGRIQ